MGVHVLNSVKFLPNLFQQKYLNFPVEKSRKRVFSSRSFFFSVVSLVAGCNQEGYWHSLTQVFLHGLEQKIPSASAFCQFRQKVKYTFFKDCFEKLLEKSEDVVATVGGLRIYAIDGQQWILQRTKDIVDHGFNGRATGHYLETYLPRAYLTHLYDVVTGVSKNFTFNSTLNEVADAKRLLGHVEKKSLVIYDRLFFSYKLMMLHFTKGNYFLIRCRSNANNAVKTLLKRKSKKRYSFTVGGKRVYLFKVKNPRDSKWMVFATNLPSTWRRQSLIEKLYKARWEVETAFKELTGTTKGEQWHSKTYNGMMQELYAKFWLINFTKISMLLSGQDPIDPFKSEYKKANFKLVFNYIATVIVKVWNKLQYLSSYIAPLLKRSTQRRKRCSRSYKRELKRPRSPYNHCKTGWHWNLN